MKIGPLTNVDQQAFLATVPSNLLPTAEKVELEQHLQGIVVTIEPFKPKHSDEQRGYYWQALRGWGDELGYSAREAETILHEEVLKEAFGTKRVTNPRGGFSQVPAKRSHDRNRTDYGHLIDTLLRFAAQHGYPIEDPRR